MTNNTNNTTMVFRVINSDALSINIFKSPPKLFKGNSLSVDFEAHLPGVFTNKHRLSDASQSSGHAFEADGQTLTIRNKFTIF